MHSLRGGTKGYFGWIDREWKHRWIFVIEEVWTMAERGHCRRRKIAAAATLLMPGKAARGLVQLHKLRPRYKLAGLQCRLFRATFFRGRNQPRFSPRLEIKSRTRVSWFTRVSHQACFQSQREVDFIPRFVSCAFDKRYLGDVIRTASHYRIPGVRSSCETPQIRLRHPGKHLLKFDTL